MAGRRAYSALLELQFRHLRRNRPVLIIFGLLVSSTFLLRNQDRLPATPTCYVTYWREDAWVQRLKQSAADLEHVRVEVAPVERFVQPDGGIVYPPHAHAIQLRPPNAPDQRWRIWYWYYGSDAQDMQPAVEWFWQVTAEHFHNQLRWSRIRLRRIWGGNTCIDRCRPR